MDENGPLSQNLSRTASSSTASTASQRSATIRVRSRKHSSALRTPSAAIEDKSLTSFPSLALETPEASSTTTENDRTTLSIVSANKGSKKPPKQKRSIVDALTAKSPSARGRNALFGDSPTSATQDVPGSVHHASDAHIQRLIARSGAVTLVRQLAQDLADREAEMSRLRYKAEMRERELKKMLREVEVSNLDIEARLHHLEQAIDDGGKGQDDASTTVLRGDDAGNRSNIAGGVGDLVEEALDDTLGKDDDLDESSLDRLEVDKQATIRATALREGDATSTHSSQETYEQKKAARGWKDYLWNGAGAHKTSRTSSVVSSMDGDRTVIRARVGSGTGLRRKGLDDALFKPPSIDEDYAVIEDGANHKSDKPRASSMTSWTLKIFAGNPQATRESEVQTGSRGRAATQASSRKDSRTTSQASVQTNSSAKASLAKIGNKNSSQGLRRSIPPLSFGPTGTLKSSSQSVRSLPLGSPATVEESNNLGPVEMDAILPHGSRPPTLTPSYHNIDNASDYLTDRFGFIYDQRRRKKEAEALLGENGIKTISSEETLASLNTNELDDSSISQQSGHDSPVSIEERQEDKPTKKWQDYLRIATFPTELLSHTPSSGNIMTISNPDIRNSLRRTPTFGEDGEALPFPSPNPTPATSSITASNAEIAKPVISTPTTPMTPMKSDFEPVKALLFQLTEVHDNLQREKTVKWNEFMRKVRVERRREGEAASPESRTNVAAMPEASLADGEMIGIATLGNKGKVGRAKYKEFKSLVLAGIPVAHRAKVWTECSGAAALRIPGYYPDLVRGGIDDPIILAQIQMDINRTLTDNVFFRRGPGVAKLNEILLAYSRRNPEVGYCQGMNLITASLLLIMPTAEDAFWVLVTMIENILPRHYYDNSLLTSRADQQVLRQYVKDLLPRLSAHLDALAIELEALTFQWFLSLFTDCLSAEALYRVWDVLLCCKDEEGNGGSTFLFQVALALLKLNEAQLIACETPGEVYAYLGGEITNHAISIDGLIRASEGLKSLVRRAEVEERRARWVSVETETIKERERIRSEVKASRGSTKKCMTSGQEAGSGVGEETEDM